MRTAIFLCTWCRGSPLTRTIVVANQKGGVGKTTTVANLATALAGLNQRVLLIDLDPQAALTASFGVDPYRLPHSMYGVLVERATPLNRILRPVGVGGSMAMAPASAELKNAEIQLATVRGKVTRLRDVLGENPFPFDFILIDTPPSLGLLMLNALVVADQLIIPVQTHYLPMRAVRDTMEAFWRVRERINTRLRLAGLLPTMYEAHSPHSNEVVEELEAVFRGQVFDIRIPLCEAFAEAPVSGQTLVETHPDHDGSVAYRQLAEVMLNYG